VKVQTKYVFEDDDILREMEKYHIQKDNMLHSCYEQMQTTLHEWIENAKYHDQNVLMDAAITDTEVEATL